MKVVFDVAAGRLAIEGDGPDLIRVLEAARELAPGITQIQIITSGGDHSETAQTEFEGSRHTQNGGPPDQSAQPAPPKTMRQFARSLSLGNSAERIAAVGYYANKIEHKQSFAPKDVDGWFTMCGFQKPAQMSVAMYDAKRKYGYVENIGRGMWKISNQGENLIIGKIEDAQG
ncbi:MAG: hypothetical protein ACYTG0_01785 [Planctomycetota bacterium]|jgi:hypothetical protein